ncbi:type II toxin-antitoxin system VapB family antitoxin [Komarekiella delphini-convector]
MVINLEIDGNLIQESLELDGDSTKRAVVEEAL